MLGKHIKRLEINKSIEFHVQMGTHWQKRQWRFSKFRTYLQCTYMRFFKSYILHRMSKIGYRLFARFSNYPLTIRFHNRDDISQCGREYIQWNKVILVKAFKQDKTLISEWKSHTKDFMMPREELFSRSRMRIKPAKFTFYKGGFHWIQVLHDGKKSLQTVKESLIISVVVTLYPWSPKTGKA